MFENKVIIVTGATSGMGTAVARLLCQQGANLLLTGRDASRGQTLVDELNANAGNADSEFVAGDVAESDFSTLLVKHALSLKGTLYGLVNAAGMIHRGTALQTTDDQWRTSMATNVDGSFFMSRAVIKGMLSSDAHDNTEESNALDGSIVNFASTCGLVGSEGLAAYCASKGAIVQLTRAMALDHAAQNIRVNAVCPGAVDTPMLMSGRQQNPLSRDDVHAMNLQSIPQNRIPDAEEIAELVCFLLSAKARHITGASIPIDGGYTAQ